MQLLNIIQYFFYIGFNWNLRIAFHILYHELRGERKYGITSSGFDNLSRLQKKGIDTTHATQYMPVSYYLLEKVFTEIAPLQIKHFVDIGCGKGRALCVAGYKGISKVTGIDFSKDLCDKAIENLVSCKQKIPALQFEVLNTNAIEYAIPVDADCIFFFNPFDDVIMKQVCATIEASLIKKPRPLTIVYVNPLHKEVFFGKGYQQIYHFQKLTYLEVLILRKAG